MKSATRCPHCGAVQESETSRTASGERDPSICPACSRSLDVDVPEGEAAPARDRERPRTLVELVASQIEGGKVNLPTLPIVAQQVLNATQNPQTTLNDLELIISRDPATAGRIMKVVNSAFYQGLTRVNSLSEAIMRLGFKKVADLTVAVGVRCLFQCSNMRFSKAMEQTWRESVACAILARQVAGMVDLDPEEAFLAGLLHHCGNTLIINTLARLGSRNKKIAALPEDIFQNLLRTLHARIGADILQTWNLPDPLPEAVRNHHAPRDAARHPLDWILFATDHLLARLENREDRQDDEPGPEELMAALGTNDLVLARLLVDMEEQIQELQEALDA